MRSITPIEPSGLDNLDNLKVDLKPSVDTLESEVISIQVVDQGSYDSAVELGQRAVWNRKRIIETLAPAKKAAHAAHRACVKMEKGFLSLVSKSERIIKQKLADYQAEKDREQQLRDEEALDGEALLSGEAVALDAVYEAMSNGSQHERNKSVVIREKWITSEEDKALWIRHIADNDHLHHLIPFEAIRSELNRMANRQGELFFFPGVKADKEKTVSIRT